MSVSQEPERVTASVAPHADGETHHHHSHALASRHVGGHHLLNVEGLSVSFTMYDPNAPFWRAGRVRSEVLRDLSLSVHVGEILAVVGASGSGKTVLADTLMGRWDQNMEVRGSIWFDGARKDADLLRALAGRGISLVPQGVGNLDPLMRVGEQVRGAARGATREARRADAERRAARQRELFLAYGLDSRVERMYPHELSGGMARRVLLMCALMDDPRLVIADEPTPGLDLDLAVHALDDLRGFADAGGGVLLIDPRYRARPARGGSRRGVQRRHRHRGDGGRELLFAEHAAPPVLEGALARDARARVRRRRGRSGKGRRMSLQACGLGFAYPCGRELFSGLDFDLDSSERVAILGPSGTGKTTLCQLLSGFLLPAAGEVLVDGDPLVPVGRLRGCASPVQLLWQHPEQAFDPRMRLGRSLSEVPGADGELLDELLSAFDAREEWLARRPSELSGGELMRLAMVRALACRPCYLIADESTAMLDAVTQAELWHVLMDLQERDGWGLALVSHSPALVSRVATRTFLLADAGK